LYVGSLQPLPLGLSFFRSCLFFSGAQEGYAVCLDTKRNKKIKAKATLPRSGPNSQARRPLPGPGLFLLPSVISRRHCEVRSNL